MNLMMSDENNRDIYITIASMPPPKPCSYCSPNPSVTTVRTGKRLQSHFVAVPLSFRQTHIFVSSGSGECLEHGYVLNSRYQVVYPFPTFQPAFQLKKDQVILLNTSYSLVACAISLCNGNTPTHWFSNFSWVRPQKVRSSPSSTVMANIKSVCAVLLKHLKTDQLCDISSKLNNLLKFLTNLNRLFLSELYPSTSTVG